MASKHIITLVCFTGLWLASCGKFEDGPDLSLRTRKARLCHDWLPEKIRVNGLDIDISHTAVIGEIIFEKSGEFFYVANPYPKGKWDIDGDQLILTTDRNGDIETERKTILRLTAKEFWAEYLDTAGNIQEWHYRAEKRERFKKNKNDSSDNNNNNPGQQQDENYPEQQTY